MLKIINNLLRNFRKVTTLDIAATSVCQLGRTRRSRQSIAYLSVFRKISLSRLSPRGLYFRLNLSKLYRYMTSDTSLYVYRGLQAALGQRRRPSEAFRAQCTRQTQHDSPVERILMCVHVESVNGEVVGSEVERLEHLAQGEMLSVSIDDDFLRSDNQHVSAQGLIDAKIVMKHAHIRATLHFRLDEAKHVLLIHAGRVMYVSVDLRSHSSDQ